MMGKGVTIFIAGVITIGIVTAMVLPGRQTAQVIGATGKATQGVLGTAISGK
jgi:hypothetical protein